MFRTVFITKGQYLTIKDEWLLINYGDTVKKVPLSDIKNLFIDNVYINISAYALQILAKYGINAILCDDTHSGLIKLGFDMLQFSVYSRITRNNDDARKYINKVKAILPPVGSVRVLQVTEKQYAGMIIMLGEKTPTENLLTTEDLIEL